MPPVKKKYADNIASARRILLLITIISTTTVSPTIILLKQQTLKSLLQNEAIMNKDFRQAINFAFDRTSYGAQGNGEDGATKVLRNTLVPPSLSKLATRILELLLGKN